MVDDDVAGFAVFAGVGFVVELDDEFGFERGGIAEDEVDGFAVDFVLVGLTVQRAGKPSLPLTLPSGKGLQKRICVDTRGYRLADR